MRFATAVLGCLLLPAAGAAADELPQMKFNEVREIAPGVFFRFSSISATDKSVPFGGSNNIWVVFEDYVALIDANFPKEAEDVVAAVRKTTSKPIRYVLDTHHHGDHAYGNAVYVREGASIVAQARCVRYLRENGLREFAEAGRGPAGRKDIAASKLEVPTLVFEDRLVLDDGKQRLEFLHFGHSHTAGDAVAYLPRHRILCTGDACVNGAYNYMGQSDSASWVRCLEGMQQLDVRLVCPGHGPLAGKDLLERQKRYFVELRREVRKGLDAGLDLEQIQKQLDLPWYREWTGVPPAAANVQHVHDELTGRVAPWDFPEDFGLYAGPSPTKESPGWKKPRRIVVPSGLMPARLDELKRIAPDVEFVPVRSAAAALDVVADADAVVGFCTPELVRAGKQLRWIQAGGEEVDGELSAELVKGPVVLTSLQRLSGPPAADQAFALLLTLTRGLREPARASGGAPPTELRGKTLLVVGLDGTGLQISRRAHAFGLRVRALDPRDLERPDFVFSLEKMDRLRQRLAEADVVVLACPLTAETRGLLGPEELRALKPTAYLINVGRRELVQLPALAEALEKRQLAGAGLGESDPEPLPADHPLRKLPGVVVGPHPAGQSPEARERHWRLYRENVRRFTAGEPLLGVVDRARGY